MIKSLIFYYHVTVCNHQKFYQFLNKVIKHTLKRTKWIALIFSKPSSHEIRMQILIKSLIFYYHVTACKHTFALFVVFHMHSRLSKCLIYFVCNLFKFSLSLICWLNPTCLDSRPTSRILIFVVVLILLKLTYEHDQAWNLMHCAIINYSIGFDAILFVSMSLLCLGSSFSRFLMLKISSV